MMKVIALFFLFLGSSSVAKTPDKGLRGTSSAVQFQDYYYVQDEDFRNFVEEEASGQEAEGCSENGVISFVSTTCCSGRCSRLFSCAP
jgi:hypothetical protein